MSGKKGGQGRQKGQGSGKAGGRPHFVPKAVVESHAATSKPNSGRPRKGSNRADDAVASQEPEVPETTLPRQGRLRPAPALAAIAAARAANSADKSTTDNTTNSTSDTTKHAAASHDSTSNPTSSTGSAPTAAARTPLRSVTETRARILAKNSSSATPAAAGNANSTSDASNAVSNGESSSTASVATHTDTEMAVDANDAETASNPKKRKAPEEREEPNVIKRRAELNGSEPSWKHPINTTDPMTMSLAEIATEIDQVKTAITNLNKAIRAEKFSTVAVR